ncbi:hypothetical protein DH09_17540 [Bacillaceae bacterium JMAK1]|nr:hypothetical protein DH09_17540 [Bacillaceae bacterium JMAK1]
MSLNISFDHVIHYIDNAHELKDEWLNKGFHAVEGGRHEHRGSYNTLLHFGIEYIEFLAIDDFELFKRVGAQDVKDSPFYAIGDDQFVEGFYKVCIRTKNLDDLAERFRKKGLQVNGPVPLSRKRPDGTLLEWSLLFVGDESSDLPLPFFIDWHETDEERIASLKDANVIHPHEAGNTSITGFTMAVHDAKQTAHNWSKWFELDVEEPAFDEKLNATVYTLNLPGAKLHFAEPKGSGLVQDTLTTRGERPFELRLHNANNVSSFTTKGANYTISGGNNNA